MPRIRFHLPVIFALGALGAVGTPLAATTEDPAQEEQSRRMDDILLTARVKGALITDKATRPHRIDIETFRGIIQLSGVVPSEADKRYAGEVVAAVPGVLEVRNAIEVRQAFARRDSEPRGAGTAGSRVARVEPSARDIDRVEDDLQVGQP